MNTRKMLDMMSVAPMNIPGRHSQEVLNVVGKVLGCFFMHEVPGIGEGAYGSMGQRGVPTLHQVQRKEAVL